MERNFDKMDKIKNKSEKLLDYIYNIVSKNNTTYNNNYYITRFVNSEGENGRVLINLGDPICLIKLEEGDEGIYFTYDIENKSCLLFNRFQVDCSEKVRKLLDLITNKSNV